MSFREKYIKYKNKYLTLKNNLESNQSGGTIPVGTIVSWDGWEPQGNGSSFYPIKKYGKVLGLVNKLNIGVINDITREEPKIISQDEMLESRLKVVPTEEVDRMRAEAKKRYEEAERKLQEVILKRETEERERLVRDTVERERVVREAEERERVRLVREAEERERPTREADERERVKRELRRVRQEKGEKKWSRQRNRGEE